MRQIAARIGCSLCAVSYNLKKFAEDGTLTTRCRSGRPRRSTKRDDFMIRRKCVADPFCSASQIKAELPQIQLSTRSIRRRLQVNFGLRAYKVTKKTFLSKKNIADRIAFCKNMATGLQLNGEKYYFQMNQIFHCFRVINHSLGDQLDKNLILDIRAQLLSIHLHAWYGVLSLQEAEALYGFYLQEQP